MTNLENPGVCHDQFQDNPFIETDGFAEGNDNSAKASTENTDVDKSFQESPYAKQETETKVAIENQFETGEGYIPKVNCLKSRYRL
jgi:hypothetical protein